VKLSISSVWPGLPEPISIDLFSGATEVSLKAGEVLFEAGDEGDGCYRLDEGALKVSISSPQGEERILTILTRGAVVGDLSMIDGLPRSATVMAIGNSRLRFISRKVFKDCADRHPEIYRYLTNLLAGRLRETDDTIAALAFLSVKGRVARALLEVAAGFGEDAESGGLVIPRMVSQKELAAMAGVARENVNRVLGEWKRRKIVSISDRKLQIHDRATLEREMMW
jgi:CRP/FNR family cyclic AMP-dependent transcriptional regulator